MDSIKFLFLLLVAITTIVVIFTLSSISFKVQEASAKCATSISGVWKGNDGGTYYISQKGRAVYWFGAQQPIREGTGFSNVFEGQFSSSDGISGKWADVPYGKARGNGDISLRCSQNGITDVLTRESASGGFGGSSWTKPADLAKTTFEWRNIQKGDCTLTTGFLNLFSNGAAIWHADVISSSSGDSWVNQRISFKDVNGNEVFAFPKFSSPTLKGGPVPFATGPGPEENKNRVWNVPTLQFPPNLFNIIKSASLSSSC
jgi:hypothetical protein